VMISHDLQLVAQYAQRVVLLHQASLVTQGPSPDVLGDVERLLEAGLEPLPVTLLAHMLGWPSPLPLDARELLSYG
jgi:energy-coupling factor transport system ATP-binding protein